MQKEINSLMLLPFFSFKTCKFGYEFRNKHSQDQMLPVRGFYTCFSGSNLSSSPTLCLITLITDFQTPQTAPAPLSSQEEFLQRSLGTQEPKILAVWLWFSLQNIFFLLV